MSVGASRGRGLYQSSFASSYDSAKVKLEFDGSDCILSEAQERNLSAPSLLYKSSKSVKASESEAGEKCLSYLLRTLRL